ncbi:membrane-associated protein, putative [Bodo saltans]|uniref:Membrane-associated protein, putative n=1 Tax=Bodo saltans TaxID=75058 RepID=A0A0S4KK44_BODSA|nr:membrane-associated protein, putative [Bodo saltans]|eukprot:CUI14943.1 membrane-associated protein, putative [Bodo saltans]
MRRAFISTQRLPSCCFSVSGGMAVQLRFASSNKPTTESEPDSTKVSTSPSSSQSRPDVAALLTAVRARDLGAAQAVLGQHWDDQYAVYVLCVVLVLVVYYTTASSMRHTTRRCQAVEQRCREELHILRDTMRGTMERWGHEMIQRDEQMMEIQKQNMLMTRTVDQMTFALKQCAPRGFTA